MPCPSSRAPPAPPSGSEHRSWRLCWAHFHASWPRDGQYLLHTPHVGRTYRQSWVFLQRLGLLGLFFIFVLTLRRCQQQSSKKTYVVKKHQPSPLELACWQWFACPWSRLLCGCAPCPRGSEHPSSPARSRSWGRSSGLRPRRGKSYRRGSTC